MERSNYALISALYSDKSRGLYSDIYFPIIKYVIVKISAELKSADKYPKRNGGTGTCSATIGVG